VNQELQKAKQQSETADKLESTFSKPVLGAQGTTNANNPPPKVVHLGTLGNAKKRNRDAMESFSNSTSTQAQEVKTLNDKTNLGEMIPEDKSLQNPHLAEGKSTKAHESGHIEKMAKL